MPFEVKTRGGRPPLRVVLTYADGTTVCHNDTRAKAGLFEKLLASLDEQGLRQLEQSISELRITNAEREQAERLLFEKQHPEAKNEVVVEEAKTA